MTRATASFTSLTIALSTAAAFGQAGPSTGALPPVEGSGTAEPAPTPAPVAPTEPASGSAAPVAPPPPAGASAPPPPGAYPGAYPGYPAAYPPPPPGYVPPPPAEEPPPTRSVSLTLSPIHLLFPIFEANIELRIVDHFAIAAIGGIGTIQAQSSTGGQTDRFDAQELGGQLIGYSSRAFDGLLFGAELLYVHVSADDIDQQSVRGVGSGWAVGPMLGYKYLARSGFTFVAQGGIQYVAVEAEASDTAGNSATEEESRWLPLLNLNLGWSF